MTIDSGGGKIAGTLEVTLVIDMTSKVVEDPLDGTRVREDGNPILERQNVSQN